MPLSLEQFYRPGGVRGYDMLLQAILESDLPVGHPLRTAAEAYQGSIAKVIGGGSPLANRAGTREATRTMDPKFVKQYLNQYAELGSDYPQTLNRLRSIEAAAPTAYAHTRPINPIHGLEPYEWSAGFNPTDPFEFIEYEKAKNAATGWAPGKIETVGASRPMWEEPWRAGATHEFGHPLSQRLDRWALQNAPYSDPVGDWYHESYHEWLDDTILQNAQKDTSFSDYAHNKMLKKSGQMLNSAEGPTERQILKQLNLKLELPRMYGPVRREDLYGLTAAQKSTLAQEPIAEAFAASKTPGQVDLRPHTNIQARPSERTIRAMRAGRGFENLIDEATEFGFRGAASPAMLARGVRGGLLGAAGDLVGRKLIDEVVPEKGPWDELARGALTGAGFGSMFGIPGAAAGAGLGALMSQVF